MKPLAHDLFCGLDQTEFGRRTYPLVEQLVACRAEHPEHMALAVRHEAPSTIAFMSRPMRNLKHPILRTRFARSREVRVFSAQSLKRPILVRTVRVIDLLNVRLTLVVGAPLLFGRSRCAADRAISLVAVGRRDIEAGAANPTISTGLRDVALLASSAAPDAALTLTRAIKLVRSLGLKRVCTLSAKQIVHVEILA